MLIGLLIVFYLQDRMTCKVCRKWFHSRQQIAQHMLVHSDVRKYKCRYCDRAFKQPSHLDQHHRIHTGNYGNTIGEQQNGNTLEKKLRARLKSMSTIQIFTNII